jgi:hypothetical protein
MSGFVVGSHPKDVIKLSINVCMCISLLYSAESLVKVCS